MEYYKLNLKQFTYKICFSFLNNKLFFFNLFLFRINFYIFSLNSLHFLLDYFCLISII
jgi:hypothetical protein